jgi:hypothetical protein
MFGIMSGREETWVTLDSLVDAINDAFRSGSVANISGEYQAVAGPL